MGMLVGTEETPAFLHSTNAAKIMMSLIKARPKAKVRLLGLCGAEGAWLGFWQEGALCSCAFKSIFLQEMGGESQIKTSKHFQFLLQFCRGVTKHCWQ